MDLTTQTATPTLVPPVTPAATPAVPVTGPVTVVPAVTPLVPVTPPAVVEPVVDTGTTSTAAPGPAPVVPPAVDFLVDAVKPEAVAEAEKSLRTENLQLKLSNLVRAQSISPGVAAALMAKVDTLTAGADAQAITNAVLGALGDNRLTDMTAPGIAQALTVDQAGKDNANALTAAMEKRNADQKKT